MGKLHWKRCDFKCRRNVERVTQERTLAGRLFQMVGAAVQKPRVPNDKLHRVTDNRLAEADHKVLHGMYWWSRLTRYGGLPVLRACRCCKMLIGHCSAAISLPYANLLHNHTLLVSEKQCGHTSVRNPGQTLSLANSVDYWRHFCFFRDSRDGGGLVTL